MRHEIVLSPFGATGPELVDAARCVEESGFAGIWTYDHLTGSMLGRGRSHDPFAILGAIATVTTEIRLGPLVANMMNRHPAQLAAAMGTLQSLSGGRAVLGLGAGAAPGSRFAGEHEALGVTLLDGPARRRRLAETIEIVRAAWAGPTAFDGEFFTLDQLDLHLAEPPPPIIVGASGARTVEVAAGVADGVNLLDVPGLPAALAALDRAPALRDGFEVSLHQFLDPAHPTGGPIPAVAEGRLDARILAITAPYDLATLRRLGDHLTR